MVSRKEICAFADFYSLMFSHFRFNNMKGAAAKEDSQTKKKKQKS